VRSREQREEIRTRLYPIGKACEVHDGTRATVPGTIVENTGVLVKVRLTDGRIVHRHDHDVFAPSGDS
jgi:hypothetical protein